MEFRVASGYYWFVLSFVWRLTACAALNLPASEPVWGYGFTNAFPTLTFDRPVALVSPPGETNRLFIAEKSGRIMVIGDLRNPKSSVFLDLRESTYTSMEAGLLGLAFHPAFATNGRFFVYRVVRGNGFVDQLSEFRCDPSSASAANPSSEKILIAQRDLNDTHNAGDLKFGPDGYLYLSLGDDGPVFPDIHDEPQAIDKGLFGGIIRIDVDSRPGNLLPNTHSSVVGNYRIPRDNPFVGITNFNGLSVAPAKVRTEFFAVGMRNPFRFTFSPFSGELISGDVGASEIEEIDIVKAGGNYGWPYMEGSKVALANPLPGGLQLPVFEYPHSVGLYGGNVVIGGLVYNGNEFPALTGKYLFGDYSSGNVWALDLNEPSPKPIWLAARSGLSTFGRHPADGAILVANHANGTIDRLAYSKPELSKVPRTLREVDAFQNIRAIQPYSSMQPYDVNTPLWSDSALKQRWIDLSHAKGKKVAFRESGAFEFPAGTVVAKHFELELTNGVAASRRRVETRFLVRTDDGIYGLTYRWGNSLTNAELVPPQGTNETFVIHDGGILKTQVWSYPSWDQCRTCHNKETGYVLSFRTHQLNRPVSAGSKTNQLAALAAAGLFENPTEIHTENLRNLVPLSDPFAPSEYKVRSYLESNCMHCHQPGGRSAAVWDASITTPLAQAHIVGETPLYYPPPAKIIDPGNLTNSYMFSRVGTRVPRFQMPPIATTITDEAFLKEMTKWITRMAPNEWQTSNIGPTLAEGAVEVYRTKLRVSSAARGLASESTFFAGRAAFGSSSFSAHLTRLGSASSAPEAGVMIRQSLAEGTTCAALIRKGEQLLFQVKGNPNLGYQTILSVPSYMGDRLKLIADGNLVSAWISGDTIEWRLLGITELSLTGPYWAGFAVASDAPSVQFASAEFEDVTLSSVEMNPLNTSEMVLPQAITLSARTANFGQGEPLISFRAGDSVIGTAANTGWSFNWTNAPVGDLLLTAILNFGGNSLTSPPVSIRASAPAAEVWLKPIDSRTLGNWSLRYGQESYYIPGQAFVDNPVVSLKLLTGDPIVIGPSTNRSALRLDTLRQAGIPATNGVERIASALHGPNPLQIAIGANDFEVHQASLYFRDWLSAGRTQTVTIVERPTGKVLAKEKVIAQPGSYLPFVFRGDLVVTIENPTGEAYLTGAFIDPVWPVNVTLESPQDGTELQQPAAVQLKVSANAPGRDITRVEIWDGTQTLLTTNAATFETVLTNLFPGEHEIKAVGYGSYGLSGQSYAISVSVLPAPSKAEFIGVDTQTHGSWKGSYGKDGWWIIGETSKAPTSVELSSPDGLFYMFADRSAEIQALERPDISDRFAACLYGYPEFSLKVNALDGQAWTAGLYFLDWQDGHRAMEVFVESPDGQVLDRRTVTEFADGQYFLWRVQGETRFRLVSKSINSVLSAVFLDRTLGPYELWRNRLFTGVEMDSLGSDFDITDSDGDGFSNLLEYSLGYDPKSAQDKPQLDYTANNGWLQINISQKSETRDFTIGFEASTDLGQWNSITPVTILQHTATGNELSFNFPARTQSYQFIRFAPVRR